MSIRLYVCLSEGNVVVTPKGQYLKTNRKRDIRSSVNTLHEGSSGLWLNVLNCQARLTKLYYAYHIAGAPACEIVCPLPNTTCNLSVRVKTISQCVNQRHK